MDTTHKVAGVNSVCTWELYIEHTVYSLKNVCGDYMMHVWRCGPCQGNCELQKSGNAVGCMCRIAGGSRIECL